ncbi:hypothetical protein Glove_221g35 [Diversispora epigaea]|uniref:Uncharacterized protein n=1 Tax=Diversispora epigaea TaxID=1348612 RepID=A0A397IF65_9GLOM|nr:hypothetical protein Glove_221g35 [Diversispora epigaea]
MIYFRIEIEIVEIVRKRSLTSVLYENDIFSDRNRNSRNRSISNILGEELTSSQLSSNSRLVLYNCPKCNRRLIDPCTKQEIEENVNLLEIEKDDIPNLTFLPRICSKRYTNQPILIEISNIIADNEVSNISSENEIEEMEEISIKSEEESVDKFSNIFENYSSPNYDSDKPIDPKSTNDNSYLWILLWIMNFWIKFNLLETATESLIKFIKLLLSEIGNSEFDTFPNSIYMTKKELGLRNDFYSFPTCLKCHKLYNKKDNCPNGKKIWAALILVSCDVSAVYYENRQYNFAGMDNINNWFIVKDSSKHLENALRWRSCNLDSARKKFTKIQELENILQTLTKEDEVLQIFEQIPKEFLFDISKTFSKQKEKVIKELIPFIKKLLNSHIKCYDNELLKVIQQLHKSHRDTWNLQQGGKYEALVHRQHINLRIKQEQHPPPHKNFEKTSSSPATPKEQQRTLPARNILVIAASPSNYPH